MKLGLCVIGCGGFAKTFAESLAGARESVDLYFASRDRRRAEAYSDSFGGLGAFGSYEEAAGDPKIDAFYICTPHDLHMEHAFLAASYGWLGDKTAAAAHTARIRALEPDFDLETFLGTMHYANEADLQHCREGLLKAGVLEG